MPAISGPPCPCRSRTGPPSTSSTSTQSHPRARCATCHARSLPQHRRRPQQGGPAPPGSAPPQRFPPRRTGYATAEQTSEETRTVERSRRSKHRPWPTTTPWPGAPPESPRCANERAAPAQPAVHPSSPKPQPQPPSRPHYNRSLLKRHIAMCPICGTLAECDPFGTPSTSQWTGAAIIVQSRRTKTCIVTQSRTSTRPMPFSLAG